MKAQRHLEQLGVKIFTGTRVENVDAEGIVVNGKRVRSRTVIWTAGVAASPAARWLGAEADKAGRVKVNADLSVPGHAEIFAVGDTALVIANTRNLVGLKSGTAVQMPGLAQPAIQQGEYVADLIRRRTTGQREPEPFWYWDKGDPGGGRTHVCGGRFAVLEVGRTGGVVIVGRRAHLLPHWFCQPALRDAAVDRAVCYQATRNGGGCRTDAGCGAEAG